MPTFQVYSGGLKVAELVGGDPVTLRAMVAQHYISPGFSGKGQTLGNTRTEIFESAIGDPDLVHCAT